MSKVVVIGIDGMDRGMVEKFQNDMPNFRKIKSGNPTIKMKSIFPPDTTPAWPTIYTGLSPASHGIVNFVDAADKKKGYKPLAVEDKYIKGKTFWDLAMKHKKKACIILPHGIYPGWEIDGIMVCRPKERDNPVSAFPESILKKYVLSKSIKALPQGFFSKNQLPDLIKLCRFRTEVEADLGLRIFKNENCDLFFIYLSALDGIQHYFWNYFDKSHPNYPGKNQYEDVIKDFYRLTDNVVGKFLNLTNSSTHTLILSDHGHGLRPFRLLNINEILKREGILIARAKKSIISPKDLNVRKWLKVKLMHFVKDYGAGYYLMKLSQMFPKWKQILSPSSDIDWERSLAYVSDLSTVKSYSYGGIRINKNIKNVGREDLIDTILNILSDIKDPNTSENILKWASRREELYKGPYIDKYPEILLELREGYGLGWEVNGDIFGTSDMYNIQPGSHKLDTPVFYMVNTGDKKYFRDEITLMDIAPTVLDLLGLKRGSGDFDGRSIFE